MAYCFKCGEQIKTVWRKLRFVSVNAKDNLIHWDTCTARGPNRQRQGKRAERGRRLEKIISETGGRK